MSIRTGGSFLAGNIAIKVQDRLFTARRTFENNQEYYDVEVPVGCSLGFTQATKIALIISGTNTTTNPILRYQTNHLQIVGGSFGGVAPIKIGELRDGGLAEMYMGTSTQYIYLATNNQDNYDTLHNTPIFRDREGNLIPLVGGVSNYNSLGLPYVKNHQLVVDNEDFLKINSQIFEYGKSNFSTEHHFFSTQRPKWKKSQNEIYELATLRDVEELAIGDQYVGVVTYSRDTINLMEAIDDQVSGDTCLVISNNTIYIYDEGSWEIQEVLNYGDSDNGKYYEVEDVDGTHGGKAIWNIIDGGKFQVFTDYSNTIDNYTITKNSQGALQVAKLLNSLTITVGGNQPVVFDGSSNQILNISLDNFYTKSEIDGYYNDNTSGKLAAFYTSGNNIKIHSLDLSEANLVVKTTGDYLKVNNQDVDASLIKYTKTGYNTTTVKGFLDKNFAFTDVANNFVTGQKINGELISTQNWVQNNLSNWASNTFLPNTFNLNLLTGLSLVLDTPSATKTSLRFTSKNIYSGATNTQDIELPLVNSNNNGLVSPDQKALWDTVTSKLDPESTIGLGLTGYIKYDSNNPIMGITGLAGRNYFKVSYENNTIGSEWLDVGLLYTSGLKVRSTGVYSYQQESTTPEDTAHLVVNRNYLNSNAVMQDAIQALNVWNSNKVVLNDIAITNLTATGATLEEIGSNIVSKTSVSITKAFPIVNSTTAGLATAAMYNQIDSNTAAIAALNGQGSVGAYLGASPTQTDITNAWNSAKPGIPVMEGANVINLSTSDTWRYMTVSGNLTWVNMGVLGGNNIATTQTLGVVKSTQNTSGMVQVENDGTMSVIGWNSLTGDIGALELDITTVSDDLATHMNDIIDLDEVETNLYPHVSIQDRDTWNGAASSASNAIPKVTSAVNNNITLWSSNGVLKDSGKAFVTNFTTPTNNGIPTALAVSNLVGNYVKKNSTIPSGNTTIYNSVITEDSNFEGILLYSGDDAFGGSPTKMGGFLVTPTYGLLQVNDEENSQSAILQATGNGTNIVINNQGTEGGVQYDFTNSIRQEAAKFYLDISNTLGNSTYSSGIEFGVSDLIIDVPTIQPKVTNTTNLGSSTYKFKDLYLSGTLKTGKISDGNNQSYGLVIPDTTSWTANKTIATNEYVDTAVSGDVTHDDSSTVSESTLLDNYYTKTQIIDLIYPIGSVFITVNNVNPSTYLPNTNWELLEDRFLLGAGSTYTGGDTGGEATHTLTIDEMPAHTHTATRLQNWEATTSSRNPGNTVQPNGSTQTSSTGGGQPHNNMPPYLVVYMWKRIALANS